MTAQRCGTCDDKQTQNTALQSRVEEYEKNRKMLVKQCAHEFELRKLAQSRVEELKGEVADWCKSYKILGAERQQELQRAERAEGALRAVRTNLNTTGVPLPFPDATVADHMQAVLDHDQAEAERLREGLECAEYALRHPESDQQFALTAACKALAGEGAG